MNSKQHATLLYRGISLSSVTALLALVVSLIAVPQPTRAASYVVTNTNNSGPGSLRQAITDANNNPGPDTITFVTGINGIPIILTGAAAEDGNASGDLDILDGGDLTIQGNGTANTIIEGTVDRIFHVCPGTGCTNTIRFKAVTIRNGSVTGGGGGIHSHSSTSRLVNSVVSANTADIGGGVYCRGTCIIINSTIGGSGQGNVASDNGGGIFNSAGTVTVDGTIVSDNEAQNGAGIFNWEDGILTIRNGSIIGGIGTGNRAYDNGGGIYNEFSGSVAVNGSTVSANKATNGAGIYNDGTLIDIKNGSIIGGTGAGNEANPNNNGMGGGIYNETGSVTVDNSSISANIAFNGGAIYNKGATVTIKNGSMIGGTGAGNTVISLGGGICTLAGTTSVDRSTISSNTAGSGGGGIYNHATLNIQNGSIIVANTVKQYGGGIYNSSIMNIWSGSIIRLNRAVWGGGISNSGTTTINDSTICANRAEYGGGIYNRLSHISVTGSHILYNRATVNGGGLFNNVNTYGATFVTGSCITGNTSRSFLNNQTAQQIAIGNWWGAASGPNTPGADSTGGAFDTSGFLPTLILGCYTYVNLPTVMK